MKVFVALILASVIYDNVNGAAFGKKPQHDLLDGSDRSN